MPLRFGLPPDPLGLQVATAPQTTNVTITATETLILSTAAWKAVPGRNYVIRTSNLHWQSTVASDVVQWHLRLAQNGAAASVSNPRIAATPTLAHVANAARGDSNWMQYRSNALSGLCIVSLCVYRIAGSGTCTTPTVNQRPRLIWVEDRGT